MSSRTIRIFLSVLLLALGFASTGRARLVEFYDYPEQFKRADLVVIARPETKTKETGERTTFGGMNEPAVVVETQFAAVLVLKGDKKLKHFVLRHYWDPKYDEAKRKNMVIVDGPGVLKFDPESNTEGEDCLMFLIMQNDGRYVPLLGQTDADLSISRLE